MKALNRYVLIFPLLFVLHQGVQITAVAQAPNLEAYRKYALTHQGDVPSGTKLFQDEQKLGCSKCHSIDGSASKAGPDLFAVGDKFGRRDLVDAVLMPSVTISPGYGTVIVETKAGVEVQGILKQSTDAGVQLMGADGKLVSVATADIKAQRGSSISLMPEGLQAGLSTREFTDLIEYLATLQQPESTLVSNHGMPSVIPELAKPVKVRPYFTNQFKVPRSKVQTGLTAFHQ
ncbi:MAG: putative glucose/L-sorbosone dehydrogenase, distantly related to bacterial beta-galactosidase, partial [Verrucomicrobiales bacterium]|nr:putative glucose/L-sorbosone dehydrogenase, distantly related to bacterial beta-galactosidase [Verrucomicrobiales bacterium]